MKPQLQLGLELLLKLLGFWMLAFFLERLISVFYFFNKLPLRGIKDIAEIFIYSLRLDLSMAAYLVTIPLLLFTLNQLVKSEAWSRSFFRIYQPLIIFLFLLINFINLNLFREWGTKLNYKAIVNFLEYPYEVFISSATNALWVPLLIYSILGYALFRLSRLPYFSLDFAARAGKMIPKIIISVFLLGMNLLFIRGGWQLSPINVSMAQYSTNPVYNHLSTNTTWQLMQNSFFELKPLKSQYNYFPNDKLDSILTASIKSDNSLAVLKPQVKSPNVVLIVLESFTADLIESLGGEKNITPNIEQLINHGILFKNVYASGDRTDKGLIAILSSFPSQATRSIIKENQKQVKLSSISQKFKNINYATSFYYGGESEFFGLKSYLLSHSFDRIVDKNEFHSKIFNSKWGAEDGLLFKRHLADMKETKVPFFSTVLTLSNHEPFEIPIPAKFKGNDLPTKFRNTAYYTDLCLGEYFEEAKKQQWYTNTLFILIADHGHRLPKEQFEIWDSGRFRIPMILFGEVLKDQYKGFTVDTYGSQTDLATTLYKQLHINFGPSLWSKDLLRKDGTNSYAFFNWDNGFGMIGNTFSLSYDEAAKKIIKLESSESITAKEYQLNYAKAYMQKIFNEYLSY